MRQVVLSKRLLLTDIRQQRHLPLQLQALIYPKSPFREIQLSQKLIVDLNADSVVNY